MNGRQDGVGIQRWTRKRQHNALGWGGRGPRPHPRLLLHHLQSHRLRPVRQLPSLWSGVRTSRTCGQREWRDIRVCRVQIRYCCHLSRRNVGRRRRRWKGCFSVIEVVVVVVVFILFPSGDFPCAKPGSGQLYNGALVARHRIPVPATNDEYVKLSQL
jgi:hypothetical protein